MKHLFVAMHGYVNHRNGGKFINNPQLNNDRGVQEMKKLGNAINTILYKDNNSSAYIISSSARAAVESSEILAEKLGLKSFEKISYLWTGPDAPKDSFYLGNDISNDLDEKSLVERLDNVMGIVDSRKDKADAIIMVADIEIVEYFAGYFTEKICGTKDAYGRLDWGKAHHIRCINEIIP